MQNGLVILRIRMRIHFFPVFRVNHTDTPSVSHRYPLWFFLRILGGGRFHAPCRGARTRMKITCISLHQMIYVRVHTFPYIYTYSIHVYFPVRRWQNPGRPIGNSMHRYYREVWSVCISCVFGAKTLQTDKGRHNRYLLYVVAVNLTKIVFWCCTCNGTFVYAEKKCKPIGKITHRYPAKKTQAHVTFCAHRVLGFGHMKAM